MNRFILIGISILSIGCGNMKHATTQNTKPAYDQQLLWEQNKIEYLLFQLDPGDRVKDGVISFDKEEDTWIYTRPHQRPLVFNNGKWILSE